MNGQLHLESFQQRYLSLRKQLSEVRMVWNSRDSDTDVSKTFFRASGLTRVDKLLFTLQKILLNANTN